MLTLSVASAMTKKIALNICFGNILVSDVFRLRWKKILKEKCETALNVKFAQNLVLFGTEIDIKIDTVFDSDTSS